MIHDTHYLHWVFCIYTTFIEAYIYDSWLVLVIFWVSVKVFSHGWVTTGSAKPRRSGFAPPSPPETQFRSTKQLQRLLLGHYISMTSSWYLHDIPMIHGYLHDIFTISSLYPHDSWYLPLWMASICHIHGRPGHIPLLRSDSSLCDEPKAKYPGYFCGKSLWKITILDDFW